VLYRRNGTFVFAIPSHDGFQPVIDSMVAANGGELAAADRLILDLRGNEGGSSSTTNALGPYVVLKEDRPNPWKGNPADRPPRSRPPRRPGGLRERGLEPSRRRENSAWTVVVVGE
jgi:hypothetical protein